MSRSPTMSKVLGGLLWGASSVGLMVLLQLVFLATMARLLDAAAFGLMAMAGVATRLLAQFSALGIGPALIQKPALEDDDVRAAIGLTLVLSLAGCAAAMLLAPLASAYFEHDELTPLIRVLALGFVLNGLAAVPLALLRRALRFRAIAVVETLSYAVGYGAVGIAAAAAGWGVWALACATLAQSALLAASAYAFVRHPLLPRWQAGRRPLLGYGLRHTLVGFVEFATANADSIVLGRFAGSTTLGLYNRALLLATLPAEKLGGIGGRVLFPMLSAVQGQPAKVAAAWVAGLAAAGVVASALSLGLAVAADEVVGVLLGSAWRDSVPLLQILSLAGPLMLMSNVCGITCDAMAWLGPKLRLQAAILLLLVLLLWAWHDRGPEGVAWAVVAAEAVRLACYLVWMGHRMHVPAGELVRAIGAVIGTAGLVSGAVAAVAGLGRGHAPPLALLAGEVVAGALAFLLALAGTVWLLRDADAGRLARRHLPWIDRLLASAPGRSLR